jgi:hypothetical protein
MELVALNQFTGSQTFTRWTPISNSVLTEGALYVADQAGAYWLFDAIQSHLDETKADWAQTVLTVNNDDSAELVMTNGNDDPLSSQKVPFTDFPQKQITIWSVRNELGAHTHMLPSEY